MQTVSQLHNFTVLIQLFQCSGHYSLCLDLTIELFVTQPSMVPVYSTCAQCIHSRHTDSVSTVLHCIIWNVLWVHIQLFLTLLSEAVDPKGVCKATYWFSKCISDCLNLVYIIAPTGFPVNIFGKNFPSVDRHLSPINFKIGFQCTILMLIF